MITVAQLKSSKVKIKVHWLISLPPCCVQVDNTKSIGIAIAVHVVVHRASVDI